MDASKKKGFLSLFRGNSSPPKEENNNSEKFYYEQIASAVGAGGWTIDFLNKKSYFDKELRCILNTPEDYRPSLNQALRYFDEEYHDQAIKEFEKLRQGIPCQHEVKMLTYNNKPFWAKSIGKPILDHRSRVTGVRGIIINIDETKERELSLKDSLDSTKSSNSRLFQFANHISHDLKNQINNLNLTSQLIDSSRIPEDQAELFENYQEISHSLTKTVTQLNEIVSIQNQAEKELESIDLQEIFEACKSKYQKLIQRENGYVYSDFTEAPVINFNLNFLENILCTLVKYGLKNSRAGNKPEVKAYSLEENGNISLVIEDNGTGIEVSEEDEYLYYSAGSGDYRLPHQAINLFVVRNQVEAMNARLEIDSRKGYGTKFIIHI